MKILSGNSPKGNWNCIAQNKGSLEKLLDTLLILFSHFLGFEIRFATEESNKILNAVDPIP